MELTYRWPAIVIRILPPGSTLAIDCSSTTDNKAFYVREADPCIVIMTVPFPVCTALWGSNSSQYLPNHLINIIQTK